MQQAVIWTNENESVNSTMMKIFQETNWKLAKLSNSWKPKTWWVFEMFKHDYAFLN